MTTDKVRKGLKGAGGVALRTSFDKSKEEAIRATPGAGGLDFVAEINKKSALAEAWRALPLAQGASVVACRCAWNAIQRLTAMKVTPSAAIKMNKDECSTTATAGAKSARISPTTQICHASA